MAIQESLRRRRLEAGLGVAAVLASFVGIFVAAALSPWFSPFLHALSFLGADGIVTAPIFNGALLLGGALGAGFVVAVWDDAQNGVHRAALVFLFPAMVFLGMTGAFPLPLLLHAVVAALFFLFSTVGVLVWGGGDFPAGRPVRGGTFVVAGTLHVVSWLWWAIFGWAGPGIAVPELVGALGLAVWALWLSYDRWPADPERERL